MRPLATMFALLLLVTAVQAQITSSGLKGMWSGDSTWVGGVLPGPTDNVVIAAGDSVTIDSTTADGYFCNNLTVNGALFYPKDAKVATLTVNGDVTVAAGATLRVQTRSVTGPYVQHMLKVYGNFTSEGVTDFRLGSNGSTAQGLHLYLTGSTNTTLALHPALSFDKNVNEMNVVTIDKTAGAKVTCLSNVYQSNNSSTGPATLFLKNGFVETGNYRWVLFSSASNVLSGGSDSSYVIGCLGRGLPTSSTGNRFYPVGDHHGYRPIYVRQNTAGSTGSHMEVRCVEGDANTGTSAFTGGIDKVCSFRYYTVTMDSITYGLATPHFTLSYGLNDGVAAGNTNLRIAASMDERATWKGVGPTTIPYTTALDSLPRMMVSDSASASTSDSVRLHGALYLALARATGTTENTLDYTVSSVEPVAGVPSGFVLERNYPNPFNPTTTIRFAVPKAAQVSLRIYDALGREVETLTNGLMEAGMYQATWNARGMASGLYFCRMQSGAFVQTQKLLLTK